MNILGKHHHKDAKPLMTFTWGAVMLNDFNKKNICSECKMYLCKGCRSRLKESKRGDKFMLVPDLEKLKEEQFPPQQGSPGSGFLSFHGRVSTNCQ